MTKNTYLQDRQLDLIAELVKLRAEYAKLQKQVERLKKKAKK